MLKTVPFQIIQFSITMQFKCKYGLIFKNISISSYSVQSNNSDQHNHAVSSIQPIDRALSGATTPCQRRARSHGNEGVLRIPQISSITGTSPSDCLESYIQDSRWVGLTPLQRCSSCILLPQATEEAYQPRGLFNARRWFIAFATYSVQT